MYIMIKNKILDIKIIFRTYLKWFKTDKSILDFQTNFYSTKIKKQFSKTVLKNYFLKLFSKTVTKQTLHFFYLNKATQNQLTKVEQLHELLQQSQSSPLTMKEQIMTIHTQTNDYLDSLEIEQIKETSSQVSRFLPWLKFLGFQWQITYDESIPSLKP